MMDLAEVRSARFQTELGELARVLFVLTDSETATMQLAVTLFQGLIAAGTHEFDLMDTLTGLERPLLALHKQRGGTHVLRPGQ